MFKAMIEYYSPFLTSIKTMFGYKTHAFLGISVVSAAAIETTVKTILNGDFLGVPILLLVITGCFFLLDMGVGIAASRKIAEEAKRLNDKEKEYNHEFKSVKLTHTIFKFISLGLWVILSLVISDFSKNISWLSPMVEGLTIIPILLFVFREFVSIGEGITILNNGNTPYLFELGGKIFDIFQFKFLRRLGGSSSSSKNKNEYED